MEKTSSKAANNPQTRDKFSTKLINRPDIGHPFLFDKCSWTERGGTKKESKAIPGPRSEEHTSELQSLMRISYAVFCLKKNISTKKTTDTSNHSNTIQNHTKTR